MSWDIADFAQRSRTLANSVRGLEPALVRLGLPPLAGREWFELLERKLLPQLGENAFLVVAVTGGTNIGKSVVFNHLAGFRASASSPLASGTKHPVCLVPEGFSERQSLEALFPSFKLVPWNEAAQALQDSDEHLLFWRTHEAVPPNLLLLDTPDVDSDAQINWQRADAVRQSADVLIAVLTQQKYNDAAVKQFFRRAAAEDKAVVVVFNQCELPDDETYWPLWLKTFSAETGVVPEYIYLAPNNRPAAEAITLDFSERTWSPEDTAPRPIEPTRVRLQDVFARFRFADIKRRTLRGSLSRLADEQAGLPGFLREVASRSAEFRTAADLLTAHELAEVDDWPAPPTPLMIGAVRAWWAAHREGWSAKVHGVYDVIGQTMWRGVSTVRDWWQTAPSPEPWDIYRTREWDAVVRTVGKVYSKLEWLSELGNSLLKSRLEQLLAGTSRIELLRRLEADHRVIDFAALLHETVTVELQSFRTENPQLFGLIKRLDEASAAARPALSVVLVFTGVGLPLGEAATQLASHGIMSAAMHVVGDVAAGTAVATVGESAISQTASSGAGYLQAKFHRLQSAFLTRRAAWLAERLQQHVLGTLATDLQTAAAVGQSSEFRAIEAQARDWAALLKDA
ncbi:MAG: GTPase [Planctomycetaceae bacterium]|nr:GTPase [Planctomycetaceae bacterium]